MRLQERPRFRAGGAVRFTRISSPRRGRCAPSRRPGSIPPTAASSILPEAYNTGAGDGSVAIMVLAFESADHALEPWMARALECCADHGGAAESAGAADAHRRRDSKADGATPSSACPMRASAL